MRLILMLILGVILCSGCAKLEHLQELLTLKDYSDNQDLQSRDIQKQDENFKELLGAVKDNRLGEFTRKRSFLRAFGEPILVNKVNRDGQLLEEWLYRYSTKYFDSEKVYVDFDSKGKFVNWRIEEPLKK